MNSWKLISAALLAACILDGCEVGPNYTAPQISLPASFEATTRPATRPATQSAASVDLTQWWRSLNDPEMDSLVTRAVESNLVLNEALIRLQESRAVQNVVVGGMMPFLEASGAAGRGSGNNSTKGRIAAPLNSAANTSGLKEITQVVGFDAGWEIDLFGRFRRQLEAAQADTEAAAEARNDAVISLISEVGRRYIQLRAAQTRLAIARQDIVVAQQTLDLVSVRYNRGITNELDVALAQRQLSVEQAAVEPLQMDVLRAQEQLAVLEGLAPGALNDELNKPTELPVPPRQVVTGLPAELLRRRPDIREAERRLAAQNARIGVATADLYPRIAITAGFGLQGQGLGRQPTADSMIWSVGPTAQMPLLDFGRIDSLIMVQDFRTKELFYNYQQTVLSALQEVDESVNDYAAQQNRLEELSKAVEAGKRALDLASGRYDRGLIDFLNVLDAQRALSSLEDEYTVAQQAEVIEYIALYKALGGGWENYQSVPEIRRAQPAVIAAVLHAANPTERSSPVERQTSNPEQ